MNWCPGVISPKPHKHVPLYAFKTLHELRETANEEKQVRTEYKVKKGTDMPMAELEGPNGASVQASLQRQGMGSEEASL